ncbi:MAG: RNA polymerase sigma factor FliA [gamma proteobacterium symbiont of Bathyaustriella thionipta]|nr:RNA polymerase sigma factor FliA [gamma proteobacterium symbiont of Bathyaustriella thionipta]MCU7951402.1 RNA polymerase sigma factor FliA [gamma proteobacterium symbiont of Bathyaustriella thionipta]MCU7953126.1 RNA polymerase sigma factor FliA [gamma proteobacterium symbiont of Bathyaustriella thionipta]MCU7957958.1 RNA polymerase sigma factor FliA [gamma proteobacterium symbiont of Bathyaustriella thionipta]
MYSSEDKQIADQLVEKYAPLVKKIAYHMSARLPADIHIDDIIQSGLIGLLDAGKHYDPKQGAQFETYATIRIRGAILDEVRRSDWAPKSVHKKARDLTATIQEIERRTGRDARDVEVAQEMGISMNEYYQILKDGSACRMLSFDDLGADDAQSMGVFEDRQQNVVNKLLEDEFHQHLSQAIAGLPERERMVMSLYYDTEMNLKEVGLLMGVSESRVSQLLSQAQLRLRARIND